MRALIVDDSSFIRDYVRNVLEEHGVECEVAPDGQTALECIVNLGPFDLALVDWNMPVMGGLDMLRMLRREKIGNSMRVMMVTTEAEYDSIVQAMEAGADEYLMKPFDDVALLNKISILGLLEI